MYLRLTTASQGKAMSPEEAAGMIEAAAGEKFQSGVVDAFVKVCGEGARGATAGA
jgi:HD-GYP domain-containing protein (c-di-GMP phosphodiesterase class II)